MKKNQQKMIKQKKKLKARRSRIKACELISS